MNFEDTVTRAVRLAIASINASNSNQAGASNMVTEETVAAAVSASIALNTSPQSASTPKTHRKTRNVPSPMKRRGKMTPSRREYTVHMRNAINRYSLESRRNPQFMVAINDIIATLNYSRTPHTTMRVYNDLGEAIDNRRRYRKRLSKRMGGITFSAAAPEEPRDETQEPAVAAAEEDQLSTAAVNEEPEAHAVAFEEEAEISDAEDHLSTAAVNEETEAHPVAVEEEAEISDAEDHLSTAAVNEEPEAHPVAVEEEAEISGANKYKPGQLLAVVYDDVWYPGISAGKELGIASTLSAADLSHPDVNELNVMSYAASYHKAKGAKRESPKPVKIVWGQCAVLAEGDIMGAERSEEVYQNTKGMITYKGLVNVPIVVRIKIVNERAITTDISAEVDAPGDTVPIALKKVSSDEVEASVLPLREGIHTVNVRCRGDLINGCPIRIMVMPDQSSFPENVKVGKITTAIVGEELQFQVDVSEAGKGELMVTISNGLHELPVRLEQDGSMFTIFTIADAVGDYFVNILWDRSPVTDEPATLRVFDPNRVKVSGDGLKRGREDNPATFIVDPTDAGHAEMKVSAEGPKSMAKVTIIANGDKTYTVTYVPTEVGIFNIKIQYGGRLIYGAPFQAKITDPRKVRFAGFPTAKDEYGNLDFFIKETYRVEVETEDAGPGDLRAEMETENAILPVQIDQASDSRYILIFTPPKDGRCIIRIRWAGSDIKGSPFKGYARVKEIPIDHTKVEIKGEGIRRSKVYVPTEFIIDGSQAGAGVPTVSITGTSEDVDVKLESYGISENMYKVTYMAERSGTHIVYVAWSDKQIPNSPYKVYVSASPHAEKVRATSFKLLIAGQTANCIVDTRDAAEGELTATCIGPTRKADVHIGRNEDGTYSLLITPKEPGNHTLNIMYGNEHEQEHIQGSPFTLKVKAPPDASQVIARGPGLNHGIVTDYNGRFICETKGAGAGQLKVRVHGPKGAFKVQMTRSSQKDRTIDVRYNPSEIGEYNIQVKWSDQHVPGSPFKINIVENEEELRDVKKKHPIDPRFTSVSHAKSSSHNSWSEDL